jgi:hypothetical protein
MTIASTIKSVFKNKSAAAITVRRRASSFTFARARCARSCMCRKMSCGCRRQYFLTQGQHWDYVNKRVLLSTIGAQILRGTISCALPAEFEKNAAAVDSGSPRRPVALLPLKNPPPVEFTGPARGVVIPKSQSPCPDCVPAGHGPHQPYEPRDVLCSVEPQFSSRDGAARARS